MKSLLCLAYWHAPQLRSQEKEFLSGKYDIHLIIMMALEGSMISCCSLEDTQLPGELASMKLKRVIVIVLNPRTADGLLKDLVSKTCWRSNNVPNPHLYSSLTPSTYLQTNLL